MSSFEDLRKIQARQQQEEARKLEAKKRLEAESRENQYRYNQARERAERARQSFLLAQEAQNNRIWHHFSSLIPEILDEFGQLIYGTRVEKKVEYTRGFLGIGSSEIVREISHKNYQVRQLGASFILGRGASDGYSVQLLGQEYPFIEQYSRVENGSEKLDFYKLDAVSNIEYCKVYYHIEKTKRYYHDELGTHEVDSNWYLNYNLNIYNIYEGIEVTESHVNYKVKLQRSDIEKALTEIWQARENNKY
jgi:hypothetical protein